MAINNNFLGRTMLTTRSVYLNISNIISSSSLGGGRSSGWEHGWTMPLKSRYRLSNSTLLGLGVVMSMGTVTPSISFGDSSMTRETILGYFLLSQRKAAGTLLLTFYVLLKGICYPIFTSYG